MNESLPLLTSNSTVLWLKVILTAASLWLLYLRYKKTVASGAPPEVRSSGARALLVLAVLFSFAVFHSFGKPRSGTFVHYGEMFHYYLGSKYFKELGYYQLYNAVIVADAEQDNALANLPFYTDLTNYQNVRRETALENSARTKTKNLFSERRWNAFKQDVSFFKEATGMPRSPVLFFLLMDHGYNASPVSTALLGMLTNVVPVTQLPLLATLDVVVVALMLALVFRCFGIELGALFSVYFFANILNDHGYVSGGLLRYDWLFCIVAGVCLLDKRRYAASASLLAVSAMMKIFPAVMFYGAGVAMFKKLRTTRKLDKDALRFVVAAGVTGLLLFLLPAVCFGSALQPWKEFSAKTSLHDSGVYVNHLGLRGIVLFEPSHLSLERFVQAYKSSHTNDIVRHWQDVKEVEFQQKKPLVMLGSLFVLACVTVIVWKSKGHEIEAVLWPLLLIYAMSYPSHYYFAFLCLFVLLFFTRADPLSAFVPLCLLLTLNAAALVTDFFRPSPIVFYTLVNIYLFVCLFSIIGFELYVSVFRNKPEGAVASPARRDVSTKRARSKKPQKVPRRA